MCPMKVYRPSPFVSGLFFYVINIVLKFNVLFIYLNYICNLNALHYDLHNNQFRKGHAASVLNSQFLNIY